MTSLRLALTRTTTSLKEFETRLREIFDDFAARPPTPAGKTYGLLFGMHLQAGAGQPTGSDGVSS